VSGQADEARPVTLVRGIEGVTEEDGPGAAALLRRVEDDLYA
jgi:F420-0:gamma-glutamyl ligase